MSTANNNNVYLEKEPGGKWNAVCTFFPERRRINEQIINLPHLKLQNIFANTYFFNVMLII